MMFMSSTCHPDIPRQKGSELRSSRHQQLKDRLDEELALEAKAEENLKAKARLFGRIFLLCMIFATFVTNVTTLVISHKCYAMSCLLCLFGCLVLWKAELCKSASPYSSICFSNLFEDKLNTAKSILKIGNELAMRTSKQRNNAREHI